MKDVAGKKRKNPPTPVDVLPPAKAAREEKASKNKTSKTPKVDKSEQTVMQVKDESSKGGGLDEKEARNRAKKKAQKKEKKKLEEAKARK